MNFLWTVFDLISSWTINKWRKTERMKLFETVDYNYINKTTSKISFYTQQKQSYAGGDCDMKIIRQTQQLILNTMIEANIWFNHMDPKLIYVNDQRIAQTRTYNMYFYLMLTSKRQYHDITLNTSKTQPGYTVVELASTVFYAPSFSMDPNFSAKEFKAFIEVVVSDTAALVNNWNRIRTIKSIEILKNCSPMSVCTLLVRADYLKQPLIIKLIPMLFMPLHKIPIDSMMNVKTEHQAECFLVPEPTRDNPYNWKITFPLHEKRLLAKTYHLNDVMRLTKKLRDRQNMIDLTDYHINTVFLWELHNNGCDFFNNKSIGGLLMYMLRSLRDHLSTGEIMSYWCPNMNLLSEIDKMIIEKYTSKLTGIIDDIHENGCKDYNIIYNYFDSS